MVYRKGDAGQSQVKPIWAAVANRYKPPYFFGSFVKLPKINREGHLRQAESFVTICGQGCSCPGAKPISNPPRQPPAPSSLQPEIARLVYHIFHSYATGVAHLQVREYLDRCSYISRAFKIEVADITFSSAELWKPVGLGRAASHNRHYCRLRYSPQTCRAE